MLVSLVRRCIRPWLFGSHPARPGQQVLKIPRGRSPVAPRLEALEERLTPTTYNVSPTGTGLNSLEGAVAQANADTTPDTILLAPGLYILTRQQTISTPNDLTLEGTASAPGATVIESGGAGFRDFYLSGTGAVTFQDLTIQRGSATDDGSGNLAPGEGGGILAKGGGNVTLRDVIVQNNYASFSGDGPSSSLGGGIFVQGGSLNIQNSVILNNFARAGSGRPSQLGGNAQGGGVFFDSGGNPNASLTITNTTVSGNSAWGGGGGPSNIDPPTGPGNGGNAAGGGIYAAGADNVTIVASTLSGNTADGGSGASGGNAQGGGATLGGVDTIINSTIAGNAASYGAGGDHGPPSSSGGGLDFTSTSIASLVNDTVSFGNFAFTQGGGINNEGGTVTLTNTIVAKNATDADGPDYFGNVQSGGHNLIGDGTGSTGFSAAKGDLVGTSLAPINPLLGPLQDNGGPTQTLALLPGSPAIAAGDNGVVSVTGPFDQRGPGFNRVVNGTIDIGAYQVQTSPPEGGGGSVAPVGPLMLFGFGFGPGDQLDLFEMDPKGQVFALAFSLANLENPSAASAQLVNTDLVLQNLMVTNGGGFPALFGDLVGSNHQSMLLMTVPIQLMPGVAFTDLLTAWQTAGL